MGPPGINLKTPNILESETARELKLKTPYHIANYLSLLHKIFCKRHIRSTGPPDVNLGRIKISQIIVARMLTLKTELDIANYSLSVKKFYAKTVGTLV